MSVDPANLDALVDDLNTGTARASAGDRLASWLAAAVEQGANDLILVAGSPPTLRVEGRLVPLGSTILDGDDAADALLPALAPHARRQYADAGIADASLRDVDGSRFRVNLHRERGRAAATIRRLPAVVPRLASLNLPAGVEALTRLSRGLVLIGGATGSGKTTTLAALVNEINLRDERHIITIEDPIEYEHPHARSLVEQVEVGIDAPDLHLLDKAPRMRMLVFDRNLDRDDVP